MQKDRLNEELPAPLPSTDTSTRKGASLQLGLDTPAAGPSDAAPPPFEQSSRDPVFDFEDNGYIIPQGGEDLPPEFTPYEAESFVNWKGDILSHDQHLNEDGEALYRFLLARAQEQPEFVLHCHGSHTENRNSTTTSTDANGNTTTRTETHSETIVDFDFKIDIAQHLLPGALLWTVPDEEPAYRGGKSKSAKDGRISDRKTNKRLRLLKESRTNQGFPPWVGGISYDGDTPDVENVNLAIHDVLQSSWTLRQWADDYCASNKIFKEFVFEKMVYGWKIGILGNAVKSAIKATGYFGNIQVTFEKRLAKVIIRRDGRFQRLYSKLWFKILLWITLIYPFIWLFQQFHPRGYGKWTVGGSAHALTRFYRNGPPPAGVPVRPEPEGVRDGDWFRIWEYSIRTMVSNRVRSSEVHTVPYIQAASLLNGGQFNPGSVTYFGA